MKRRATTYVPGATSVVALVWCYCCVAAASEYSFPGAPYEMAALASQQELLKNVTIVSEVDFLALLKKKGVAVDDATRIQAAEIAALSNVPFALGIAGPVERGGSVRGGIFIIARDPTLTSKGTVQATDYYVAAVHLNGKVRWAVTQPSLLLRSVSSLEDVNDSAGCAPLLGPGTDPHSSDALPMEIILNLESSARKRNAASNLIELRVFSNGNAQWLTRYACAGAIRVGDSKSSPLRKGAPDVGYKTSVSLPQDAVVLLEKDFQNVLKGTKHARISPSARQIAAKLISMASESSFLEIRSQIAVGQRFSTSLVVVVRNATLSGSSLIAKEFYLVPMQFEGASDLSARGGFLAFRDELPALNFDSSICGPLLAPEVPRFDCARGVCVDPPFIWTWSARGLSIGDHRRPNPIDNHDKEEPYPRDKVGRPYPVSDAGQAYSRPTMRLYQRSGSAWRISAIACTMSLRSPEREVRQCGAPDTGLPIAETCNGRDDDCNGLIDDRNACSFVESCPAQPRTCGGRTCGSIPDNCGGVLRCGGPCP